MSKNSLLELRMLRLRSHDPAPRVGLKCENFKQSCPNGFGDGHNSYAHTMAWFLDHLYVGTTRANLCMVKVFRDDHYRFLDEGWPVECPDDIYRLDRRAQIWRHDPREGRWEMVMRSPMVTGVDGTEVARDMGYRGMAIFQGESDSSPSLYVVTSAPGRGHGPLILRSTDGIEFIPASEYGILGLPITTVRALTPFDGRLFTAPAGVRGGKVNASGIGQVYESRDPAKGIWRAASIPGFGDSENQTVFELQVFAGYLYAGTLNNSGFQVWRTDAKGNPPYRWERIIHAGAGRGALNQAVASFQVFGDRLYLGTGIQGGGFDYIKGIGPAPAELILIRPDKSWDLVIGSARNTTEGYKVPLSGLPAGFGGFFNGYFWRMEVHNNWLYLGTYNSATMLPWISFDRAPPRVKSILSQVNIDSIFANEAGFDLWRSADGENWLPIHRQGFGNPYNYGVRTLVSTPYGLYLGTANPFGPRVAVREDDQWVYRDNPRGGLEVWRGEDCP